MPHGGVIRKAPASVLVPLALILALSYPGGPLPVSAGSAVMAGVPAPVQYRAVEGAGREFWPLPYARAVNEGHGMTEADRRVATGQGALDFLGYYSVRDGAIRLHPDLPPETAERTVLPHEYGHAFVQDLLARESRDTRELQAYRAALAGVVRGYPEAGSGLPDILGPAVADYLVAEPDLYDRGGYFTSSLSEYLAESYRLVLLGDGRVPPATRAFLLGFTVPSPP